MRHGRCRRGWGEVVGRRISVRAKTPGRACCETCWFLGGFSSVAVLPVLGALGRYVVGGGTRSICMVGMHCVTGDLGGGGIGKERG